MSSFISAAPVASGQVQSLDSLRGHSLPTDAMILASATQVNPTNQNTGSYIVNDQVSGATPTINGSVPAVTASPFADLYKEGSVFIDGVAADYISTALTGYTMSQGISMEMFVNYQNFTNSTYTIGFMAASAATYNFTLGVNGSAAPIVTWTGGTLVSSVTVSANTWNHLACSWDGTTLRLYVNGALGNSTTSFTPPTLAQNFLVGRANSLTCTAYVTDVRIVTNPAVYVASTLTVPSAPLSPAAAGTTNFMLRIGQNSPTVQNGALTFDRGLKQFANFGAATFNIVTQGFTAVWRGKFNQASTGYDRLFEFGSGSYSVSSTGANILVFRNGAGSTQLGFYIQATNSTSSFGLSSTSGVANVGTTAIVSFRYNPVTQIADIWVNGVQNNQATVTTAQLVGDRTTNFTYLAQSSYSGDPFASLSSNTFAIYNRALSNVEIYNSYLALNTVPATPQQKTLEIGDINGTPALSVAGNGQVSVQSIGLSSNVVPWPPAAMTGYDTVINGQVYKARASSDNASGGLSSWFAFDKTTGRWSSNGADYTVYNSSAATCTYAGTVTTTDVNGTVYYGQWLQIQQPSPIVVSSYQVQSRYDAGNGSGEPRTWVVLGSRDGVNWVPIDQRYNVTWSGASSVNTLTVTPGQAFTYFRLITSVVGAGFSGQTNVVIGEWTLYGTADTSPALTIAPATTFNTSVATPSLTGIAGSAFVPQDFSSSGLNVPAYVVSNTATVANTVQYSSMGPFAGEGSLYFQGGTGAYVQFPPSTPPASMSPVTPFTAEAWVYFTAYPPTGAAGIFESAQLAMSSVENWGLGVLADGRLSGFIYNTVPAAYNPVLSTVPLNTWSHVALTYDGTSVRVFLNGTSSSPTTFSGTPRLLTNSYFWVGVNYVSGFGKPTNAYIASARIVSGQALYTTTFTPPTAPLQPIQGVTQAGLPYGTVLLLRNAPAPGRIQTTKFSGANSVGLGGAPQVLSFPPAAMTGYSTALNAGYGQGTYVASASSDQFIGSAAYAAWTAFAKGASGALGWVTVSGTYNTSAPYGPTGSTATVDVNGTSYAGEWLQLQSPSSIVLANYQINTGGSSGTQRPSKWFLLGSRDGTNWFLIDSQSNPTLITSTFVTFPVSSGQAFTYFRWVVNQVGGAAFVNGGSVVFNGSIESVNVTADGRVGLGVVNPTRALEVAGDVVSAGTVSAGNPLMFRNRIINGDMRIAQRGTTSFSGLSTVAYCFDRFATYIAGTGGGTRTINQVTDVPFGGPFFYSANVIYTAQTTGVVETFLRQGIELANSTDLTKTPITVSFWYKSNRTGTHGVRLFSNTSAISNMTDTALGFNVNNGNTWEYKVLTFGNSVNSSLITSASLNQLGISLDIGPMVAGQTSITINNNDYFTLTGVQLEKGSVSTPFEVRPYATELALCQRYYEKSHNQAVIPANGYTDDGARYIGTAWATTNLHIPVFFEVPKRPGITSSGITFSNSSSIVGAGQWGLYTSAGAFTAKTLTLDGVTERSLTVGMSQTGLYGNSYIVTGGWTASSEL